MIHSHTAWVSIFCSKIFRALICAAISSLFVPSFVWASSLSEGANKAASEDRALTEAIAALIEAPVFDGHNDTPAQLRSRFGNMINDFDFTDTTKPHNPDSSYGDSVMHTDIGRLRAGRVGTQFWSVWVTTQQSEPEAVRAVIEQIDVLKRLIARYPDDLALVTDSAGIENERKKGRIAGLIGLEGGHSIASSLAVLRQLYALGARYMTITHSRNTPWADSATDAPNHGGLSDFGREVIREMNRLGMLVDLSHVSQATMIDALETTKAPVIFSHSALRSIDQHPRNVPDTLLPMIKANGGVVMIVALPDYISETIRLWEAQKAAESARATRLSPGDPKAAQAALEQWVAAHPRPRASIGEVADHIDAIRRRIGVEHIGIGGDFDGMSSTVVGLEDVSTYPALFAELVRRGYTRADIAKIARGNMLRVLRGAEAYAAAHASEVPIETPIETATTQ